MYYKIKYAPDFKDLVQKEENCASVSHLSSKHTICLIQSLKPLGIIDYLLFRSRFAFAKS